MAGLEDPSQRRRITGEGSLTPLSEKNVTNGTLSSALKNILPYERIDILLTTTKIVTQTTKTDTELAEEQGAGIRPVAVIYQALLNKVKVVEEQLEMGSAELKWLHRQRDSLRLRPYGVLKGRVVCSVSTNTQRQHDIENTCLSSFRNSKDNQPVAADRALAKNKLYDKEDCQKLQSLSNSQT